MKEYFWADKIARKIVEKEEKLNRGIKIFRTESGLGASGIPHIGSLGDVIRNFAVSLALKDLGKESELIAFSDDRDGLRKVPLGFPNWLEKYIGVPVTDIKDPFDCHESYGKHMSSLLLDAIEKVGIKCKHHSGTETYKNGLLNEQIEKILLNAELIKKIVKKSVGQELVTLYFPVCENCGKIYTTRVIKVLQKEHKVLYKCDQEFLGKNLNTNKEILIKGCNFEGETSYYDGSGKLAWKAEFAARWDALKIVFEAVGKDIVDSVKVNDEVDRKILNYEPPTHLVYELFLEKGGKKISKSIGNVFSPQDWLKYGSTESIRLLMLKRFVGTRTISESDIPTYMDEIDRLEKIYFGREKIKEEMRLPHLKRLFEYVHFLKPPKKPTLKIPYNILVNLIKVLPIEFDKKFEISKNILIHSGHIKILSGEEEEEFKNRVKYVTNWIEVMEKEIKPVKISLKEDEKEALKELKKALGEKIGPEEIQTELFEIARKYKIDVSRFFQIIYLIVLGINKGPRAGELISLIGNGHVIKMIDKIL